MILIYINICTTGLVCNSNSLPLIVIRKHQESTAIIRPTPSRQIWSGLGRQFWPLDAGRIRCAPEVRSLPPTAARTRHDGMMPTGSESFHHILFQLDSVGKRVEFKEVGYREDKADSLPYKICL